MPTVPQIPLPKKQQPAPGQETADNISEMRGSFRQAAAEASSRVMKKAFSSLYSALRFKDRQEDYSDETRKNFQGVSDSLDNVSERVGYAVSILQEINQIQMKSLRLLRDILFSVKKNKTPSIFDKLPKSLLNLLKIAGLAGISLARSRIGGLASRALLGANALNTLEKVDDSVSKNIQPVEPLSPDALAPKNQASGEEKDGGGDDEDEKAQELTQLTNDFEKHVLGEDQQIPGADATAISEQGQTPANLSQINLNQSTTPISSPNINQTSTTNITPTNINQSKTSISPTNINQTLISTTPPNLSQSSTTNIIPTNINQQSTQLTSLSTNAPENFAQPQAVALNKENVSATATKADQQNGMAELSAKNQIDSASKLTRSLVFSSDTITFSADEIEFIQKKIENIKSEEIQKLTDTEEEDFHKREPKSKTGSEQDGAPGTPGTTPQGPAGSNPGNSSTPFNGQLNPELGEIKTRSGLTTRVAKDMVPKFQGFVSDLESTGYQIRELGGYANRMNVNNPSVPSAHAYGAAIDINPSSNPNQSRQTDMPREQVQNLIQKHGLGWGLNWQSLGDPMHFSAMPNEGGTGVPNATTTPSSQGGGTTGGDVTGGSTGGGSTGTGSSSGGGSTGGGSTGSGTASSVSGRELGGMSGSSGGGGETISTPSATPAAAPPAATSVTTPTQPPATSAVATPVATTPATVSPTTSAIDTNPPATPALATPVATTPATVSPTTSAININPPATSSATVSPTTVPPAVTSSTTTSAINTNTPATPALATPAATTPASKETTTSAQAATPVSQPPATPASSDKDIEYKNAQHQAYMSRLKAKIKVMDDDLNDALSLGATTDEANKHAMRMYGKRAFESKVEIDIGTEMERLSKAASPLKPRPTIDQLLNKVTIDQRADAGVGSAPKSYFDQSKSLVNDPTKVGNVEPNDANKRITELFGDYNQFGNVGSLG